MVSQSRLIFLGGLGRSGSTLLVRLLGELPGVVPLGEVTHLWRRGLIDRQPCGCGEALPDCPFWREIGDRAFGGWAAFDAARQLALGRRVDRTRRLLRPADRTAVRRYLDAYLRVYEAAREISGRSTVIDSSKHASLAHCLRRAGDLDLKVVHVVRDGRAVAHSWAKEIPGMTRWHPIRTAAHWVVQNAAMTRITPDVKIVYEDFLDDPAVRLREVAEALGLSPDPLPINGTRATLTSAHTASGNPMRFITGELELRRDDAWRTDMPMTHRVAVTLLTAPWRFS